MTDPKKPIQQIVLGIIKNKSGRVLLIKRVSPERGSDGKYLEWAFPGGVVEENETPEQAVVREMRDETGYGTQVVKLISERDHPSYPVHIKYFACEILKERTSIVEETDEIELSKWVDTKQLGEYITTNLDPGVAGYLDIQQ